MSKTFPQLYYWNPKITYTIKYNYHKILYVFISIPVVIPRSNQITRPNEQNINQNVAKVFTTMARRYVVCSNANWKQPSIGG